MKRLRHLLARVPITVKVPVVVALLMAAIGVVASEQVLTRLVATQERQIRDLANAYLDGLAAPLVEPVLRADPWEIFDVLDQTRQSYAAVRPVKTVVADAAGLVLAGSDPRATPIGSKLPSAFAVEQAPVLIHQGFPSAFARRDLVVEGRTIGSVHTQFDISPLVAERREVTLALLSTNTAITLFFVALGWIAVRRMVRPMKILSDHLKDAKGGRVAPIAPALLPPPDSEAGLLFRRYNQMVASLNENTALAARLSEEERLASLGHLASGMAHEINNPLGGLFNAIDTLKKHGEKPVVRANSLSLIERGLRGIQDVVEAALATYRARDGGRPLALRDFEDVRLLLGPELRRRGQALDWNVGSEPLPELPGNPVRQAILNLLLNASAAAGKHGSLRLTASIEAPAGLKVEIHDSGPGMPVDGAAVLAGGAVNAITRGGKGLGLWMVRRLVDEIGGNIETGSSDLGGAMVRLRFEAAASARSDAA